MTAMSEDAGSYRVEHVSKFEPWLLRNLCEPVVKVIPAWISPNMITMVNACVIVLMFALCTISPRLAPLDRLLALFGAAVAMFSSMILDSVDGMHARRTNQTSKLGEFLDHWLDTVHVPLVSSSIALMLEVPAVILGLTLLSSVTIYHAQLALYHRGGKFVHPPTSGMEAQVIATVLLLTSGVVFYLWPRYTPGVGWFVIGAALSSFYFQARQVKFFYERLEWKLGGHLPFVLQGVALYALHLLGALGRLGFVVAVVALSFRGSGTYVLRTLAKRSYDGHEIATWGFLALAFAAHFFAADQIIMGQPLSAVIIGLCAVHQVLRNFADVSRDYLVLRPVRS